MFALPAKPAVLHSPNFYRAGLISCSTVKAQCHPLFLAALDWIALSERDVPCFQLCLLALPLLPPPTINIKILPGQMFRQKSSWARQ